MKNFYLISGTLGSYEDVSPNMIFSIKKCHMLFVEEIDVFEKFIKDNNISVDAKVLELGMQGNSKYYSTIDRVFGKGGNIGIFESSGIPCFIDPGTDILQEVYRLKEEQEDISISYISGGSGVTAALSLCGFDIDKFSFMYFLSQNCRNEVFNNSHPYIYFLRNTDFDKVLSYLDFMKGENSRKVCLGINIGKKGIPYANLVFRDTEKYIYEKLTRIYADCVSKNIIPDIFFVFDKEKL